jgi:hypothetical protein
VPVTCQVIVTANFRAVEKTVACSNSLLLNPFNAAHIAPWRQASSGT